MSNNITVMLSSTIADMSADRDAVLTLFSRYPFVEIIGAKPIQKSFAANPYINTLNMAEACDFYILLLGARYGHEIASGISATEAEFDRAVQVNPTKILVFRNSSVAPEPKQKKFITKVSDYYKGYWVAEYQNTLDLQNLVNDSFLSLLKERAAIGSRLMHVDHFIRLAIQRRPVSDAVVYYSVTCDNIELTYECYGCTHHIQFTRARVSSDFWGSVSELETQFRKWR